MPNTRIYWLHALSPTHAGIGRGVGYIDLPIDRDGVTGWPIIRGSAFKGVWADITPYNFSERTSTKDARRATRRTGSCRKPRSASRATTTTPMPGHDSYRRETRLPAGAQFSRHFRLVYLAALLADAAADAELAGRKGCPTPRWG